MRKLWTLAERADLGYWRPRWFWERLMWATDHYHGYKNPLSDYQERE